jgi:nucleotide-binding universal stress UspA family protein
MGSQGTTAAERLFFGGHAVYAMQHLKYPLITVPIEASFAAINKIALASDFDHITDKLNIDEIKKLQQDFNAELHIINPGKNEKFDAEVVFESVTLQELLKDNNVKFHFITNRDTDDGILHFAETNAIDLLIVLPKKHSFIEKIMHRSHTKRLVLHSHVPVMALHV